jgi:hypothetical protein
MSDAVERLKWFCSPDAEAIRWRAHQSVCQIEAITELEQRIEFMGAIYRIPVSNCCRAVLNVRAA